MEHFLTHFCVGRCYVHDRKAAVERAEQLCLLLTHRGNRVRLVLRQEDQQKQNYTTELAQRHIIIFSIFLYSTSLSRPL